MNIIKAIKTEKDYNAALSRLENIFDSMPGTKTGDEAEVIMILISDYERIHYPIEAPTPVEAIKFRMEQMNLQQKDLAKYFGSTSRVSEILNGKRALTIDMIAALHHGLGIPLASLIKTNNPMRSSTRSASYSTRTTISLAREAKGKYRKKKV